MAKVLLYNIIDANKRMKIKLSLFKTGLSCLDIQPEEFGHPLGYLLGLDGFAPSGSGEAFSDEMLVMYDLNPQQFSALLDSLRSGGTPVALKAVVTETNLAWSSSRLHRELAAEHRAMSKGAGSRHASR